MTPQNKPDITQQGTNKEKVIIGFFIGAIMATCIHHFWPFLAGKVKELSAGFLLLVLALGFVFFLITLYKEWFFEKIFGVSKADLNDVKNSSKELVGSIVKNDWEETEKHFENTFGKVSAWYVWLSYRRWVITVFYTLFLGFAGLLGAVLIYNQNQLITKQNEKFDKQNEFIEAQTKRLDQQTYLQEAERRSSLVFLFSNIMDAVDKELKDDYRNNKKRDLSPQLTGRIIALSTRLKPYRYLDGDTLVAKPLSPERGQLLVSLVESQLDSITMGNIYAKANFQKTDLRAAYLDKADLSGAYFYGADLNGADLKKANLRRTDLRTADLKKADLSGADLNGADLSGTNLSRANLSRANLSADLSGANLNRADLNRTNLRKADLRAVDLRKARVEKNFFQKIQNYKSDSIIGIKYILSNYQLDSTGNNWGKKYFLKKKE